MSDETFIPRDFAKEFPDGALCGCDCSCNRVLNDGNVMGRVVVEPERDWNGTELSGAVVLIVCADCYVGAHSDGAHKENA